MYLGEGVFLASPGVSVYTKDEEYRVGSWPDMITDSATGQLEVAVWECLIWNVVDNSQAEFDASKISTFQDGYSLFCEAEDAFGGGRLNALNTKGEITEFTCEFVPNKPGHNFPVPALTRRPAPAFMTLREIWSLICHRITWVEYPTQVKWE